MAKSVATIVQGMINYVKGIFPTAVTAEGTILNDVVLTAPARPISQLYSDLDTASYGQALDTAADAQLDVLGKNWGVVRKAARPALGTITFYTANAPVSDIVIPVNTVVSTQATSTASGVQFQTTQTVTMYASLAGSYLNIATGRYEISTSIVALQAGNSGLISANTISILTTTVSGIAGCYNPSDTFAATPQESTLSLSTRIGTQLTGNNVSSSDGYLNAVLANANVDDALVIGHGETGRDAVCAVDIYVKGVLISIQTDVFLLPFQTMVLSQQPTIPGSVSNVLSSVSGSVNGALWTQAIDTSTNRGSVAAQDAIYWATPLNSTYGAIYVTYNYNSLVSQLQAIFSNPNKDVLDTNVLVKWAQELLIDATFNIKVITGFDASTVITAVKTAVITLLNAYTIGQEVQQSDIIQVIVNTPGVDDVAVPFTLFQSDDASVLPNAYNNLVIPAYSYAAAGAILPVLVSSM